MANKPTIGLLGGPGSGKSLVARQMASLGCAVIDADVLAKRALDDPQVKRQLTAWWGAGVLSPDGRVDRGELAKIVFADRSQLDRLEALLHPRVFAGREALRKEALGDGCVRAVVEDCPLLLETGLERECDVLVFIDAPLEARRARVREERGWSWQELDRRDKNQAPLDIKRLKADYMIINDAGEAYCLEQTRRVLSQITT